MSRKWLWFVGAVLLAIAVAVPLGAMAQEAEVVGEWSESGTAATVAGEGSVDTYTLKIPAQGSVKLTLQQTSGQCLPGPKPRTNSREQDDGDFGMWLKHPYQTRNYSVESGSSGCRHVLHYTLDDMEPVEVTVQVYLYEPGFTADYTLMADGVLLQPVPAEETEVEPMDEADPGEEVPSGTGATGRID